ncbi:MAG: polyprenyl synthetase family protein [Methylacidiphilales bacterium]|nr:polyprenyl synthetase family protein [Candidatus Methylacidiphilales bacterium]MDW8348700.1 polyprenyl synthetase family protein [Verrucomicrobiae bacterium]
MSIKDYWQSRQKLVDEALDRYLPKENEKPETLHRAMRYSLFAGGKRLRPVLTLAACEAVGGDYRRAMPLACAVECIHTYSLIHDDLPCMDDDDFRRGKPTNHRVFGEGVAVLAGDALQALAFYLISQSKAGRRYEHRAYLAELAWAAGSHALVGGQVADMEGERKKLSLEELEFIHRGKTAALICSSLRLGAMAGDAGEAELRAITRFGQAVGLAFQVVDDILDVTQTSEKLGKSAGKDIAAEKSTYPALLGLEEAKKVAERLTKKAIDALKVLGQKGERLKELANLMLKREN